jgi:hypothetical protein
MKFLMLHYFDESELSWDDGPTVPDAAVDQEIDAWVRQMESSGVKLHGGRLRPVAEALTVRVRGGEQLLTDGPFAETKEQIAGFDVLECDTLAQAVNVASRHPSARYGTLELRPFWD